MLIGLLLGLLQEIHLSSHYKIYCFANWIKLFKSCRFRFFFTSWFIHLPIYLNRRFTYTDTIFLSISYLLQVQLNALFKISGYCVETHIIVRMLSF